MTDQAKRSTAVFEEMPVAFEAVERALLAGLNAAVDLSGRVGLDEFPGLDDSIVQLREAKASLELIRRTIGSAASLSRLAWDHVAEAHPDGIDATGFLSDGDLRDGQTLFLLRVQHKALLGVDLLKCRSASQRDEAVPKAFRV